MGSNASKQYAPTARKVLSRRGMQENLKKSAEAEAEASHMSRGGASETSSQTRKDGSRVKSTMRAEAANSGTSGTDGAERAPVPSPRPAWDARSSRDPLKEESLMDPTILKEMSTWSMVKSEDDKHQLKLMQEKGKEMASVIRFQEETELKTKFGQAPKQLSGNLTETQLFELLKNVRDKPKVFTMEKVSKDYDISLDAATAIISSARFPHLQTATETTDMYIAK